ncbi:hypothetical protein [Hymenobacter sp. B81]|uniref:hypothetical protein n=1 Tax=Hymenobacter sp. B81 TaxID=3344878 RepID=UPI0037DC9A6C
MKHAYSLRPLLLALLGLPLAALAQTPGSVGIGTTTPNPRAALDLSATDKGLLIPRLSEAQRTAMSSVPDGLMVFQTDGPAPGFWYYFGGQWNAIPNQHTAAVTAGNGLSKTGNELQLGGTLTQPTAVAAGAQPLTITSTATDYNTNLVTEDANYGGAITGQLTASTVWQSFTVQQSGGLYRAFIQPGVGSSTGTQQYRLELLQGSGTSGAVLRSVVTASAAGSAISAQFTTPLPVVAGEVYTLRVQRLAGSGLPTFPYADANPYPEGTSSIGPDSDLRFSTFIVQPAAPTTTLSVNRARVGIGTGSPQADLHVAGLSGLSNVRFSSLGGNGAGLVGTDNNGGLSRQDYPQLSKSGNTIALTNGGSVPDSDQQTLSISGSTISISGVSGAGSAVTVPGDNLGNHSATQNLALNNRELLLRTAGDADHGLGYYGTTRTLWQNTHINGPVLYGFNGGALGSNVDGTQGTALRWTSQGRVGIGTFTPETALDVVGDTRVTGTLRTNTADGDKLYFTTQANGSKLAHTTNWSLDYHGGPGNVAGATGQHRFFTTADQAWQERMRIAANGRVGIGTTTPQQLLDVAGTARAQTFQLAPPPSDLAPSITARTVPDGQDAATERSELILFHGNDGSNGFGPDLITLRAPALRLQTYNSSAVNDIDNAAGSNTRLYVAPAGQVGIGTTTPQAQLDVNGSVRLGPQGSVFRNLQTGSASFNGCSTSTCSYLITFPTPFTSTPLVQLTVNSQPNTDYWDTFAVTARSVSPTQVVVNIRRVDENASWAQVLRVVWMAWEQ